MTEFRLAAGDDSRRKSRKGKKSSRRSSRSRKSSRSTSKRRSSSRRQSSKEFEKSLDRKNSLAKKKKAQGKQQVLDWLHLLLLGLQLLALIAAICAAVVMYNVMYYEGQAIYYLIQSMIEMLLFTVAGMTICYANRFFRICLLSGHLCSATFAFFLVKSNQETKGVHFKCWNDGPGCVWVWPLRSSLHIFYLGLVAGFVHIVLALISMMVIFFYEGSVDQYNQMDLGMKKLEGQMLAEEVAHRASHARRSSMRKRRSKKTQKRGKAQVLVPEGSVIKQKKETKRTDGVILDTAGRPRGYGTAVTEKKTTICETPNYVSQRTSSKTDVISLQKKAPKSTETSSKQSQTESTKTAQKPGKFNSISKMPALESPIAYLNRREKENDKKSSYAF